MSPLLTAAPRSDRSCVEHLMQFYYHDLSEWAPISLTPRGRYRTPDLQVYWDRDDYHPFLVHVDGELAGFILMDTDVVAAESEYNVGEFFVARRFRRRGIGRAAAFELFDRFVGRWEVFQLAENLAGITFWRRTIEAYTGGRYEEFRLPIRGFPCVQQRFSSRRPADVQ